MEPENNRLACLDVAPFATLRARRICIIKPSALGDVVQSLPVIHAVRHRFPCATLSWVINDSFAPLIEPAGVVDEVIRFERDNFRSMTPISRGRLWEFGRLLKSKKFDLVIDLQGLFRSAAMGWVTGAPVRIGLASAREGATLSYTHIANDLPIERGAVDRYWSVAELLGVGDLPKEFPLRISNAERHAATSMMGSLPRPWIAVNAGSRWQTKRWPAEHFAASMERSVGPRKGSVVIIGGPSEESVADEVARGLTIPYVNLAGRTSLRSLAAVLESVDLLVTNDSGPMHLAAAVGTPTVSIFTCTSPARAGAFGPGHSILQTSVSCRASYIKQCSRMDCMKELTSNKLLPILNDSLDSLRQEISRAA